MTAFGALAGRVRLLVSRAVVALVDDAQKLQDVQVTVLEGEARARAERFQQYGLTSVPLAGAEAIALSVGGSRSHLVVVAVDDRRHRLRELKPGEVALYTDEGDRIVLRRGRVVEVFAGQRVLVTAPEVECTGNLRVGGKLHVEGDTTFSGSVTASGKRIDDTHTHSGVMPGGGFSGAPT